MIKFLTIIVLGTALVVYMYTEVFEHWTIPEKDKSEIWVKREGNIECSGIKNNSRVGSCYRITP